MRLTDGTGTQNSAKVDSQNRLSTTAVVQENDRLINIESGKVWSLPFEDLSATANDDYVIYIKNTGDAILAVTDIRVTSSAAVQLEIHSVSGTASGGSDITPVSRTVGSASVPTATLQSGSDITGLSNDGIIFFMTPDPSATDMHHLLTSSNILIPKGKAIAILSEASSPTITGIISLVELE